MSSQNTIYTAPLAKQYTISVHVQSEYQVRMLTDMVVAGTRQTLVTKLVVTDTLGHVQHCLVVIRMYTSI